MLHNFKKIDSAHHVGALSFEQELFASLYEKIPNAMVNINQFRIEGPLDVEILRKSIEYVHHRHETLRTTFPLIKGLRKAKVAAPSFFELPIKNLTHLANADQEVAISEMVQAIGNEHYDFEKSPVLRAYLVQLGSQKNYFIYATFHMNFERWSSINFFSEVVDFYCSLCTGQPTLVPHLQVQYSDYVNWQKSEFSDDVLQKGLQMWNQNFSPAQQVSLAKGPHEKTKDGETKVFKHLIPAEKVIRIKSFCQVENIPAPLLVFIAFGMSIHQTSKNDIVLLESVKIAESRYLPEIENLIGVFVETVPCIMKFDHALNFRSLVKEVTGFQSFINSCRVPYQILKTSAPADKRWPQAKWVFNFLENAPPHSTVSLPGTTTKLHKPLSQMAGFKIPELGLEFQGLPDGRKILYMDNEIEIMFALLEVKDEYRCQFRYSSALNFQESDIEGFARSIDKNIEWILENA